MTTLSTSYGQLCADYQRIEQAIYFLEANFQRQPELKEIANSSGLSEYHFQRLFTRWAGISPKRFLQFLTKENAKELLKYSSVLDATYSVGLSSPSRLHDLFISTEAVTPGQYKTNGEGLLIRFGIHPTPFGQALIGITDRGICHLSFVQTDLDTSLNILKKKWTRAVLMEDSQSTGALITPVFSLGSNPAPISLFLSGTNFQLKVWEALLNVPRGSVTTYEQVAAQIGEPNAMRAVGAAIGQNPIAYLIPCHRVIRKMGEFGNYRWGTARKKALLGWETARSISSINPI
jgi:AraC family transcriptional regulator of adaptative response/methylated-DNA-[protein]-cysteine methyltransferase